MLMHYTKFINSSVNPTIDTDAYTANDVMGGLLSFDVSSLTVNGGLINQAILVDEDAVAADLTLYLFESTPATIADDAAFAPVIADMNKLVAVIAFADADKSTVNSIDYLIKEDINNVFTTTDGTLYGYLVDGTGGTWTNADAITIRLYIVSE